MHDSTDNYDRPWKSEQLTDHDTDRGAAINLYNSSEIHNWRDKLLTDWNELKSKDEWVVRFLWVRTTATGHWFLPISKSSLRWYETGQSQGNLPHPGTELQKVKVQVFDWIIQTVKSSVLHTKLLIRIFRPLSMTEKKS